MKHHVKWIVYSLLQWYSPHWQAVHGITSVVWPFHCCLLPSHKCLPQRWTTGLYLRAINTHGRPQPTHFLLWSGPRWAYPHRVDQDSTENTQHHQRQRWKLGVNTKCLSSMVSIQIQTLLLLFDHIMLHYSGPLCPGELKLLKSKTTYVTNKRHNKID